MSIKRICVFAASSPGIPEIYLEHGEEMARILSENGIEMVYGAGARGIMGRMADTMLASGGQVTGIIPGFMLEMGWARDHLTHLIIVENMAQRKQLMIENVDAVIAMPGGIGTLEELTEVLTLKQLGQFTAPIIILNAEGYYNPLLNFFEHMTGLRFMRDIHQQLWEVVTSPSEVLEAISGAPAWDSSAIKYAAVPGKDEI